MKSTHFTAPLPVWSFIIFKNCIWQTISCCGIFGCLCLFLVSLFGSMEASVSLITVTLSSLIIEKVLLITFLVVLRIFVAIHSCMIFFLIWRFDLNLNYKFREYWHHCCCKLFQLRIFLLVFLFLLSLKYTYIHMICIYKFCLWNLVTLPRFAFVWITYSILSSYPLGHGKNCFCLLVQTFLYFRKKTFFLWILFSVPHFKARYLHFSYTLVWIRHQ